MALVVADRVWETTSTSGTGTLTLSGAVSGYQTFAVIGDGNTTYYTITNGTDWEVGIGTYTSSGTTLSRDTVLASSLGGTTKITVTPGSFVFVDYPASKAVYEDASNIVTVPTLAIDTSGTDAQIAPNTGIAGWNYSGLSKSIGAEESAPSGLFFSPDGLNMYVNGSVGDDVNQYTLSTAWDVSTATYVRLFSIASQDSVPTDVFFKPDGLAMFILGDTNNSVFQYTLSSAWDISTASYASKSFSVASQETQPNGLWFKSDGTIMYVLGQSADTVFQYTLGTAWDLSTASYASISFSVASQEGTPNQVNLSADGLTMWILGATGDDISQYTLGIAWNVSTATFVNNFYIGFQDTNPQGLFINSTAANRVYVLGTGTDAVYQYNTATNSISAVTDVFNTTSNARVQGNLAVQGSANIDASLIAGNLTVGTTSVSGTLTATSTITLGGSTSSTTGLGTSATTGTTFIGGTSQTGAITVGQSTVSQTTNIQAGATGSGSTKTLNIGTAGVSGSTTAINIGSAVSGATSTTTLNGSVNIASTNISGGTINGTTIGATTPASIVGTTITGQTGRLNGTGTNLFTQSQNFTTGGWVVGTPAATITANVTTAPDSTSTGNSILSTSTSTNNFVYKTVTSITTTAYTASVYAKKLDSNFLNITFYDGANGSRHWFNISNGTLGSTAAVGSGFTNLSGTITSAGNGWYRCTVTATTLSVASLQTYFTFTDADASLTQTTAKTNYIWGAQLEVGNTANTYIPTTTTAVYGTPTLSFSGVSTLGLESNGALFLQPAGTGAIQAQATTSTTAGGNVRGAYATDWQTGRSAAARVASASFGIVGGGNNNSATAYNATTAGGESNQASGNYSFIGGGASHTSSGTYSFVGGGATNSSTGFYNFIGGGFTNSGTSGSAVTTQSGTMNATTAVTLSGSNASIKVGQYITGTSIAGDTYVAAISGTSLTLSKVASGSSTSTLSFFTPHGVVVGGGNNQATGAYSFIGGGGDAGTAANRNVASGAWSAIVGGNRNTASGLGSFIGGNGGDGAAFYPNTASGVSSAIVCGTNNTASGSFSFIGSGISHGSTGTYAFIGAGVGNTANGFSSAIVGGTNGNTRSITGNHVFPACNNPIANATGVSQSALLVLGKQTTDATATALTSDGGATGTTNQVILPNNSAYYFRGEIVSGVTGGGNTKGFFIEGVIKRGANAASTALVGTPTVTSNYADAGASAWAIAVTADTTNGGLRVTFTGQAATTIRTVAQIRTTEMTY